MAVPIEIAGKFAELPKKATLGALCNVNLKPVGDKKFLLLICLSKGLP
jgi:hypothetical protein